MMVDGLTATCTALNFTAQNNISAGNNLTVSGTLNCTVMNSTGANYTLLSGVNSNLTIYANGSAGFRGVVFLGNGQISSNCFAFDSTFSHLNNHNSTDYCITQSSRGLTTVNAKTGNAVRTAVNNTLTANFAASSWAVGTDALNQPAWSATGNGPVVVGGGYTTFSGLSGALSLASLWESASGTTMGELRFFVKTRDVTYPWSCMVSIYISRQKGNQATYTQQSFHNNGMSISSYSINASSDLAITMISITGSPQLYSTWIYTGILSKSPLTI